MAELRVPALVENPFRDHYRALILGSALRTIEAEADRLRADGRESRARRVERDSNRLPGRDEPAVPHAETRLFGPRARVAAGLGWIAASSLLLEEVVATGVDSRMCTITDVAVIFFTLLWFGVSIDDLRTQKADPPQQLELFDHGATAGS